MVADDHGFAHIRRCLETVLDLRGRNVLPAGGDDDVLDPVDDPHVGAVDPFANVSGLEPAVFGERLGCLFRLVPVADEHAVVFGLDLSGLLVNPEPNARMGFADRAKNHPPWHVPGGYGRVFCHAVALVGRNPDPDEELEHFGSDGSGTGAGEPAPAQSEPLL